MDSFSEGFLIISTYKCIVNHHNFPYLEPFKGTFIRNPTLFGLIITAPIIDKFEGLGASDLGSCLGSDLEALNPNQP